MKSPKFYVIVIILVMGVVSANASTNVNQVTNVSFGLMAPETGWLDYLYTPIYQGAQLAVDELNADPDLADYSFSLTVYDTQSEPATTELAMNQAVADGVHIIIGPDSSADTMAAIPIGAANQIPMISYSSTSPDITLADDQGYMWRTVPSDVIQGYAMAKLASNSSSTRMSVIVVDISWGVAHIDVITEGFESLGGEVVSSYTYTQGTTDFSELVDSVVADEAEILAVVGFQSRPHLLSEINDRDLEFRVVTNSEISEDQLTPAGLTLEDIEGLVTVGALQRETPMTDVFHNEFVSVFGEEPGAFADHVYDAIYAGALAIEAAGSLVGADIINALATLNFDGASGPIFFDENGDCLGSLYQFKELQNGEYRVVAEFDYSNGLQMLDAGFQLSWSGPPAESSEQVETPLLISVLVLVPLLTHVLVRKKR